MGMGELRQQVNGVGSFEAPRPKPRGRALRVSAGDGLGPGRPVRKPPRVPPPHSPPQDPGRRGDIYCSTHARWAALSVHAGTGAVGALGPPGQGGQSLGCSNIIRSESLPGLKLQVAAGDGGEASSGNLLCGDNSDRGHTRRLL